MQPFRVILDVCADNEDVVEPWAIQFLEGRGFNVVAPNAKWESVGEFKKRLGISYGTVANKVRPRAERPTVLVQHGPLNKQIVAILSNPDFDAYCVNGRQFVGR